MNSYLIGRVNWAPQDTRYPKLWMLEERFGLVIDDLLFISLPWYSMDGASIPRVLRGALGHPFEGTNKFWSPPHDEGYAGNCIVINLKTTTIPAIDLLYSSEDTLKSLMVDISEWTQREWDKVLREAMVASQSTAKAKWYVRVGQLAKLFMVYRGLRTGGWVTWKRNQEARLKAIQDKYDLPFATILSPVRTA